MLSLKLGLNDGACFVICHLKIRPEGYFTLFISTISVYIYLRLLEFSLLPLLLGSVHLILSCTWL